MTRPAAEITSGPDEAPRAAWLRTVCRLPARGLLAIIAVYQRFLSPALPVVTLGACACRFTPTCSHYAAEAVRTHGAVVGAFLAIRRLIKCTPLHPGGDDPVPPRGSLRARPVCFRTTHLSQHLP